MINVNKALVDSYLKTTKRHRFYAKSINIKNHNSFHIDGFESDDDEGENPYFNKLIGERRPNESANILAYRKKIYLSKTTQPCFKVLNSLKKIVKSQDWKIDYSKSVVPGITKSDTLQDYCEKNYPVFNSLENWLYTYAVQYIITDPNSLIYVEPYNWDIANNDKYSPVAKFASSEDLLDYKDGEYALFKTDRLQTITVEKSSYDLPIYCIMTKDAIIDLVPIDLEKNYKIDIKWQHNLGYLFCFKSGGIYKKYEVGNPLYVSFINPMLSGLDAVAREISDLDAEVVQHIYSTMWYIAGNDCKDCKGTGMINRYGQQTACSKCDGNGRMLKSPYKDIVVSQKLGESNLPTPPAGYVQKQTEIVKLQDERIANHIYDALGALNMEFLAQSPLNQSGVAKEVDRDELNNYVYSVAYHLVENVLNPIYKMVCDMRYIGAVPSIKERTEMLPIINIPEKYDLLSTNTLVDNYKKMKESNLDQNIISEIENDLINKMFANEPDVRKRLMVNKELDPLKGLSMEDKTAMLMVQGITKEDLIVSNYITELTLLAYEKDNNFFNLDLTKQREIVYQLAKTKETTVKVEPSKPDVFE